MKINIKHLLLLVFVLSFYQSDRKTIGGQENHLHHNLKKGEIMTKTIHMKVNQREFTITLEENATVEAFIKLLPTEINMVDVNRNEKFFMFDKSFPTYPKKVKQIQAGDIMLYGKNGLVIFYESFSTPYSYTRIGKIENVTNLKETLGQSDVTVTFNKKGE